MSQPNTRATARSRRRHGLGSGLSSALLLGLIGCDEPTVTPPPVEEAAPTPPELTEVRLGVMTLEDAFRWDEELRGLVTVAVELGLSDLPGTLVVLPDGGSAPTVLVERARPRRVVEARLSGRGGAEAVTFALELCPPSVPCVTHTAVAPREAPWPAIGALLDGAAGTLGVRVDDATRAAWVAPGSADPYAELLTGRAAATYLGILPPPVDAGDRRRDPVARAVFLDPSQPLAQWILARWELGSTADGGGAGTALKRAALARPTSPLLAADLATLHLRTGRPQDAVELFGALSRAAPDDPRWLEPYAATLLAVGRPLEARAVIDRVPADFAWDPTYARLRVLVAEGVAEDCRTRVGRAAEECALDLDPLLEHWQRADPRAVEPVMRRLQARVTARDYEGALPLVAALGARAPGPRTDAIHAALLTAAGRVEDAAALAPPEVAARLRARATREARPGEPVTGLPPGDAAAAQADADAALWRDEPARALATVDALLLGAPKDPDALATRARALDALGRAGAAAAAWQEAWWVDPAGEGGPVATTRIASTFRWDEAPPLPTPPAPPGPQP